MTNPTNEHREQAREIVRLWCADSFDALRDGESLQSPPGAMTELTNRIASALSSRDREVREVLEGLRNNHGCWCPGSEEYEFKPPFVCGSHCQRARALYTKLQPKQ